MKGQEDAEKNPNHVCKNKRFFAMEELRLRTRPRGASSQGDLAPAQGPAERAGCHALRRPGQAGRGGAEVQPTSAGPAPQSAPGPCHVPSKGCL